MNTSNLANTALRTIGVLKKLSDGDCFLEELADGFSDDTLRIYLNSLKKCGIKILPPSRSKRKYSLRGNLDFLNLKPSEYRILAKIKTHYAQKNDYEAVMNINRLLVRLAGYTKEENSKKLLKIAQAPPFSPKYNNLIKEISGYIKDRQPVVVTYVSPTSADNYFEILPEKIITQKSKTYLLGIDNSINSTRYLLLSRIKLIKKLEKSYENFDIQNFVLCEFFVDEKSLAEFENYEIIEHLKDKIVAKIYYENELVFLQKVLAFGHECKIIAPDDLKNLFIQKIRQTEMLYEL